MMSGTFSAINVWQNVRFKIHSHLALLKYANIFSDFNTIIQVLGIRHDLDLVSTVSFRFVSWIVESAKFEPTVYSVLFYTYYPYGYDE